MGKNVPEPEAHYREQRTAALTANWRKLGFSPTSKNPRVWGILMEIGYPNAVVALHCLLNGSVSFFFGYGKSITGMGANDSVRMKAEEFLLAAETNFKKLNPVKKYPLPEIDRVRFYVMTYDGIYTAQDNRNIANDDHELFSLFRSGHEVIAAMRSAQDASHQEETPNE